MLLRIQPYDNEEREKILKGQSGHLFEKVFDKDVRFDLREFVHLSLIMEHDSHRYGFRNAKELASRIGLARSIIYSYFGSNALHFFSDEGVRNIGARRDATERVGVGFSLLVMNRVFGLTVADWSRIDEIHGKKTLDFWSAASPAKRMIAVEAKGTVISDLNKKSNTMSKMKRDIIDKKNEKATGFDEGYGVIVSVGTGVNSRSIAHVVDPPGDGFRGDLFKFKLLARLDYYISSLEMFSRSAVVAVLRDRFSVIANSPNYENLDRLKISGNQNIAAPDQILSGYWNSRGTIYGRVVNSNRGAYFVGMDSIIVERLVSQDFSEITRSGRNVYGGEVLKDVYRFRDGGGRGLFREVEIEYFVSDSGIAIGWQIEG